jgi:radical SAM superfamily enzyme YgiQ (UPF0313 family)
MSLLAHLKENLIAGPMIRLGQYRNQRLTCCRNTYHSTELEVEYGFLFEEREPLISIESMFLENHNMRVLLLNPAFSQTFYSLERVLRMLGRKAVHPPLGLITVAALLPQDWELKLIDLTFQTINQRDWDTCDLVLISGMNVQHQGIVEMTQEAKKRGKKVAVGGPAVFHGPRQALRDGADIVVVGELESCVDRFLHALNLNESGVIISGDARPDLKSWPSPRFDLLDVNKYLTMGVQFSRGCPFQCEFCDVTHMLGRQVRIKSSSQVIAELDALRRLGWKENIFFVDDNFVGNRSAAKLLLKELISWHTSVGHCFDFNAQVSVNVAKDQELLDLMVEAGFYKVFLGIETDDQESLEKTKKHQNSRTDLDKACHKIIKAGLQIEAGWIVGFDNEAPGADHRVIDFARRNHIPQILVNFLEAPPGTDLWKRLTSEGREPFVPSEKATSLIGLINYETIRPVAQLTQEVINIYESLYDPESYYQRAFEEFSSMMPRRLKRAPRLPSLAQLRALLLTLGRRGILSRSRGSFWKYFVKGLWSFSGRFEYFIHTLILFEHHDDFRKTIVKTIANELRLVASDAESAKQFMEAPAVVSAHRG